MNFNYFCSILYIYKPGRDIENGPNGGTWIGVNKQGRFSVLTNWRKPVDQPPMRGAKSRGLQNGVVHE